MTLCVSFDFHDSRSAVDTSGKLTGRNMAPLLFLGGVAFFVNCVTTVNHGGHCGDTPKISFSSQKSVVRFTKIIDLAFFGMARRGLIAMIRVLLTGTAIDASPSCIFSTQLAFSLCCAQGFLQHHGSASSWIRFCEEEMCVKHSPCLAFLDGHNVAP